MLVKWSVVATNISDSEGTQTYIGWYISITLVFGFTKGTQQRTSYYSIYYIYYYMLVHALQYITYPNVYVLSISLPSLNYKADIL